MSQFRFSKTIALRYLWSRRSEAFVSIITFISIVGVAIGVMVLNVVIAIMTGFEFELRSKIVDANSHIVVRKVGGRINEWHDVRDKLASVQGVESVSAFTYHQVLLRSQSSTQGLLVRGIEEGSQAARMLGTYIDGHNEGEDLFASRDVNVTTDLGEEDKASLPAIVVGKELARSNGILVGAPIAILAPQVESSPFGLVPRFKRFVVTGTYSSGLVEYESGLAYIRLQEAQKFFRMNDSISGFEVRVHDIYQSRAISEQISSGLGGLSSGFYVQDWTEVNKPLWDALKLEKKVYFLVLLLIIVMASFSIITTLIMIVLEKRKDIAILRTMGASSRAISNIFVIQGAVIGALGTAGGLLLGYLACLLLREYGFPIDERIFQMSTLPVRMEPVNFISIGAASFFICLVATVYPARRASSLQPSEVLRYE